MPTMPVIESGSDHDDEAILAALAALPRRPAPAGLVESFQRRLASETTMPRGDLAVPSRWRKRVVRVAIAAGLGLAALGTWSRLSRPHRTPQTLAGIAGFGLLGLDDFGLVAPAAAQGMLAPRYEPMTFDTARLHPVRLSYMRYQFRKGKLVGTDTVVYSLTRSAGTDGDWIVSLEKASGHAYGTDSVHLGRASLQALSEAYSVRSLEDESSGLARITFSDSTARVHGESRDVRYRLVPGGKERTGIYTRSMDTAFTLPPSRYPRIISSAGAIVELMFKLMAAPIESGWQRSILISAPRGTFVDKDGRMAFVPLDLEVAGSESVDSPHGKVDCWRLLGHGANSESTYLVRKNDGLLVSMRVMFDLKGTAFASEAVLIGER